MTLPRIMIPAGQDIVLSLAVASDPNAGIHAHCRFQVADVPPVHDRYHSNLKDEDGMMAWLCDIHNWHRTYGNILDQAMSNSYAEVLRVYT